MPDQNIEYYARRAIEERRRAETATDAGARRSHLSMAERYEALRDGLPVAPGIVGRG